MDVPAAVDGERAAKVTPFAASPEGRHVDNLEKSDPSEKSVQAGRLSALRQGEQHALKPRPCELQLQGSGFQRHTALHHQNPCLLNQREGNAFELR